MRVYMETSHSGRFYDCSPDSFNENNKWPQSVMPKADDLQYFTVQAKTPKILIPKYFNVQIYNVVHNNFQLEIMTTPLKQFVECLFFLEG